MTFELRAAVESVVSDTDLATPQDIAERVAQLAPQKELRSVLAQALVQFVRVHLSQRRMDNPILRPASANPAGPSRRVQAIRDHWQAALADRVHVGGDAGWKALGACTYDDLIYAANERRALASRALDTADRLVALADGLKACGVDTVAELPETVLASGILPAAS